MSDQQSIRDELADLIPLGFEERDGVRDVFEAADRIMASPVIRRIQAAALRRAGEDIILARRSTWGFTDNKAVDPYGDASVWLFNEALRIENEE